MKVPLLASCLALVVAPSFAEEDREFRPSPLTRSEALPRQPWQADEAAAKEWQEPFAKALRRMLEAGLPDPAKLPYHKIEIPTGNCSSGDDGITTTEGWLLPKGDTEARFAIAWSGLVYPLVADKGAADLAATVAAMLEEKVDEWHSLRSGETLTVSPSNSTLLRCLYLERLGFHDAAVKLMAANQAAERATKPLAENELLMALAGDWIWFLYDRAVCAHMRGDPKLALASLDEIMRIHPELKKWPRSPEAKEKDDEAWLEEMEAFRKECQRRIAGKKSGIIDEKALVAGNPGVAALIDALDRIQMPQPGQPADVPLWESAVVRALAAKGAEAVEPLLNCLESDPRFTQSVHYWRRHHRSRTILGVHEAALYALQSLLEADFFQLASTGDSLSGRDPAYRKKLASAIRADWERHGRSTGPERAFRILQDDAAGIDAWMQAGNALLHKTEFDEESGKPIPPKGPMPGESLRAKRDPSVSDLLERRAAEAGRQADAGDEDAGHGRMALLAILLDWDQERGRAAIGKLAAHWLKNDVWSSEKIGVLQRFIPEVADKAPEILPVFEAMAWTLAPNDYPSDFEHHSDFVTAMYVKHGKVLKRQDLWTNPESPWCLAKLGMRPLEDVIGCWKEKELLDKPPFREMVAGLLKDDSVCGEVFEKEDGPGYWWIRDDDDSGGTGFSKDDPKVGLKPGESLPVRRKDATGKALMNSRYLSNKSQEPVLEYYWSIKSRDEWLAKVTAEFNAPEKEPAEQGDKSE